MVRDKSVAIIVPMFNEEKGAAICVNRVFQEINKLKHQIRMIVVNDGSFDSTLEILKKRKTKFKDKLIIVSYLRNKGYGKALQEGIRIASQEMFEYALFMDSDLTNDPRDIRKFIDKLDTNPDCVKASRYIKGGSMKNVPFKRQLISKLGNNVASLMFGFGIHDCTNGFRMTKISFLKRIKYRESSFSIILEELYYLKKFNAKVIEIPVVLNSRANTKTHFQYKPITFYNYGKYVIKALFV